MCHQNVSKVLLHFSLQTCLHFREEFSIFPLTNDATDILVFALLAKKDERCFDWRSSSLKKEKEVEGNQRRPKLSRVIIKEVVLQ